MANLFTISRRGVDAQTDQYARYTYRQDQIGDYANLSFFVGSSRIQGLFSDDILTPLGRLAQVKVGLQTGDNAFYIRKLASSESNRPYSIADASMIVPPEDITTLSDEQKLKGMSQDTPHFLRTTSIRAAQGGWMAERRGPEWVKPREAGKV